MIFLSQIEGLVANSGLIPPDTGEDYVYLLSITYGGTAICESITGRLEGSTYKFYGVEELVKCHMELNNLTVCEYYFNYYRKWSGSDPVHVSTSQYAILYHGAKLITNPANQTADQLLTKRFLFQTTRIWLLPGQSIRIPYYNTTENLTMSVHREYRDGSNDSNFTVGVNDTGLSYYGRSYNANYLFERFTFGDRSLEIYYLTDEFAEHFKFRNVFNIEQLVGFAASIEMDPSEEHDESYQDKVLKAYDRDQKLEVKVTTAALPSFMYDSLLALCRASAVQYKEDGTWYDIIITKYKLDKPSKPSTPIKLELTFEFADTERLEVMRY